MSKVEDKLEKRLNEALDAMETFEVGSEEYDAALDTVERLYKVRTERITADNEEVKAKREARNRLIVDLTVPAVGLGFKHLWLLWGTKYEETGSINSFFLRNFYQKDKIV